MRTALTRRRESGTHEAKPQYTVVPAGTAEALAGVTWRSPPRVNSVVETLRPDLPMMVGAEPSGHEVKKAAEQNASAQALETARESKAEEGTHE